MASEVDPLPPSAPSTRIEEIGARAEAATKGPWEVSIDYSGPESGSCETGYARVFGPGADEIVEYTHREDCEFIAHARADVPWLLDQLAEKDAELARLTRIVEIKTAHINRLLPCPDCRDKVEAGDCQRCRAQRAERAKEAAETALAEARDEAVTMMRGMESARDAAMDERNALIAENARLASQLAGLREVCICAAIQLPDGELFRGHRHDDAIQTAGKAHVERALIVSAEQGFITSRNRFVGREEGAALQTAAGIPPAQTGRPPEGMLFSEDLYLRSTKGQTLAALHAAQERPQRTDVLYTCRSCGHESLVNAETHRPRGCDRTNCNGTQEPSQAQPPRTTKEGDA